MQFENRPLLKLTILSVFLCMIFYVPSQAEVIQESGSLLEFFSGQEDGCAYDNWISHASEANWSEYPYENNYDFAPPELDPENNDFGRYQVVDSLGNPDQVLADWSYIFRSLIDGDVAAADNRLVNSWFADYYDLVRLNDNGTIYYMLREVLDNSYYDNNGTPDDSANHVAGSFYLSWGLYVFKPSAIHSDVVIQVVHPSADFMAPHVALDAFFTIDAGMFFQAAASRQKAFPGDVYASNSLSDPSRIARSPFHEAHKAAVDLIDDELVIQVHSYDANKHNHDYTGRASSSCELSAGHAYTGGYPYPDDYDDHPNQSLMDVDNYFDILSLTPEFPIGADFYGNHDPVQVDSFLAANYQYYDIANYFQNGDGVRIPDHVDLPGYALNVQTIYSHDRDWYDPADGFENWLHIEMDEFPNVIMYQNIGGTLHASILDFYGVDINNPAVPTHHNFATAVDYYHPLYVSIRGYFDGSTPVWIDVPVSASGTEGDLIEFTVTGTDYDRDPVTIDLVTGATGYTFNDQGNGTATFSWQTAGGDEGDYTATFTISDGVNSTDAIVSISVTAAGPEVAYASSEETILGTVQGSYTNTTASDDSYEILTERESGGKPSKRHSVLEHVWTFQITGFDLELNAEAYHSANGENDDFVLAGSFDGQNYTDLITVTKTSDNDAEQTAQIDGEATGNYYIRVKDTDQTQGNRSLDSFYLDLLSITYLTGDMPNQPPVWTDVPESITEYAGNMIQFTVTGADPDDDNLNISLATDVPEGYGFTDNGDGTASFSWQTAVDDLGDYTATFTISDGELTDEVTVPIHVVEAPEPGTMVVSAIDLSVNVINKNISTCTGVITVLDLSDGSVEGALVSATWSDLYSADVQGTTDGSGQVTFVTENVRRPNGYFTLTVTDVTKVDWTYDSDNSVTTASLGVGDYAAGSDGLTLNHREIIPDVTMLDPAYPNPFNNQTTIRFGLPEDERVRITVYDLTGRRVSTLIDRHAQAGWHSEVWTPRLLANGEYLVRMESGEFVKTRRMVFLK